MHFADCVFSFCRHIQWAIHNPLSTSFSGKRVFEELDKDKDGKVSADDISAVMRKMKLPSSYARKFMHSKQKPWPANSIGWTEFASLMQEKEPTIIRLFNSLGVSKHGTIHRAHVQHFLRQHNFSVSDATVTAMMEAVGGEKDSVKYGQFRKFMLLVPTEQLRSDPWYFYKDVLTCLSCYGGVY